MDKEPFIAIEGSSVLEAQEGTQGRWLSPCLQILDGKAITQQGWSDALLRDPCPLAESMKHQGERIAGQWLIGLREEEKA